MFTYLVEVIHIQSKKIMQAEKLVLNHKMTDLEKKEIHEEMSCNYGGHNFMLNIYKLESVIAEVL